MRTRLLPIVQLQEILAATKDSEDLGFEPLSASRTIEDDTDCRRHPWARILVKVYEVDPLECLKCGTEMKIITVIQEPEEIRSIFAHLVKIAEGFRAFTASI